jgi:hypothetical protein
MADDIPARLDEIKATLAVHTETLHELVRLATTNIDVSRAILEEIRTQQTTRIARLE